MDRPTLHRAQAVLAQYFGYAAFRPAQLPAVEAVLAGRDAVIVLPTGGGKSICFQVPALCLSRLTVVVSPLISLMADQVQALERRGIPATFLNSTLAPDEAEARVDRIRRREIKLVYVAPERLAVGPTARMLATAGVDLLAIDEAHCVSEWGQDFRPSYLRLAEVRRTIGDPQTVALTATATPGVRRDIARLLELRNPLVIVGGFDRPNLSFRVQAVKDEADRHAAMVRRLRVERDPVVVYAATRRQVEQVARLLSRQGLNAVPYHAGLPPARRSATQDAFMGGSAQMIVATNAFGMGIDKPNVRLVLHYLHSSSLEDYYQEAGRAGRDGQRSNCLLLFNVHDRLVHDRMRQHGHVAEELLRRVWLVLASMSAGRRPVPLDARPIAARLGRGARSDQVTRALTLIEERELVTAIQRPDRIRIRLLASPLRVECERASLGDSAASLLIRAVSTSGDDGEWISLSATDEGLPHRRFESAVRELEGRQLIYAEWTPVRAVVNGGSVQRQRLERTILQLRTRREAERTKLNAMVGYATTLMCRRKYILTYFGDQATGESSCDQCDVCAPEQGERRELSE
jgi:ATP-dependent DNA helicase RecQ